MKWSRMLSQVQSWPGSQIRVCTPVNDAKRWGGMLASIFSQNGTTQNISNRAESVLQRKGKEISHCADTYRTTRASAVFVLPPKSRG